MSRSSVSRKAVLLRGMGGLAAAVGAASIALGAFATSASAGGNPSFDGIVAATTPTGFLSSPLSYDISQGPVTIEFDVATTNLTDSSQEVGLNFSADHILTYDGSDVSDGQPGQPGITFTGPSGTTQVQMPGSQSFTVTWDANQAVTIQRQYVLDTCGYFQLDIWAPVSDLQDGSNGAIATSDPSQRDRATLASGFIRILGCGGSGPRPPPSPTSTPTPTPTGSVQPTATPSPTPSTDPAGGVLGLSTPSTGAGGGDGGELELGALLLSVGLLLLFAARRRSATGARLPRMDV